MKQTPLKRISKKRRELLRAEAIMAVEMLKKCLGYCMDCGKAAPLEPSHTRDRKRFILVCRDCHSPGGVHKYLEEEK